MVGQAPVNNHCATEPLGLLLPALTGGARQTICIEITLTRGILHSKKLVRILLNYFIENIIK